jgi:NAD(P)H-nitrite reductase large subunit
MLSYLLSGKKTFEDTIINHQTWYEEHNITLHKGDINNDKRSALVNDRVFANIQKDGTYSVVPRIFFGN